MSGLQNQDRITNGGRASSSDGMSRFYNQVRSRQNRYQFMFLTFFLVKDIQYPRRAPTVRRECVEDWRLALSVAE
jgi:hypothetical protein